MQNEPAHQVCKPKISHSVTSAPLQRLQMCFHLHTGVKRRREKKKTHSSYLPHTFPHLYQKPWVAGGEVWWQRLNERFLNEAEL